MDAEAVYVQEYAHSHKVNTACWRYGHGSTRRDAQKLHSIRYENWRGEKERSIYIYFPSSKGVYVIRSTCYFYLGGGRNRLKRGRINKAGLVLYTVLSGQKRTYVVGVSSLNLLAQRNMQPGEDVCPTHSRVHAWISQWPDLQLGDLYTYLVDTREQHTNININLWRRTTNF